MRRSSRGLSSLSVARAQHHVMLGPMLGPSDRHAGMTLDGDEMAMRWRGKRHSMVTTLRLQVEPGRRTAHPERQLWTLEWCKCSPGSSAGRFVTFEGIIMMWHCNMFGRI
jgi:hypothetical protein